jgi:hypothetical protein
MGNHNPYNEEEQTTQWPKEKVQKDKQRSSKHIIFHINPTNGLTCAMCQTFISLKEISMVY